MNQYPDFTYITKSKLMSYYKCENLLLHQLKRSSTTRKLGESLYGLDNYKVKELAKDYFDSGITIQYNNDIQTSYAETLEAIKNPQVIHHPVFIYEDLVCSPDLLQPIQSGQFIAWDIVPSINTKKENEILMGFHRYTIEKLNLPIKDFKILKINPKYIRREELDIQSFFHEMLFTTKADKVQEEIKILIKELRSLKNRNQKEIFETGNRFCGNFKSCPIPEECFPNLGDGDIFNLRESAKIALDLYNKGIFYLNEIPNDIELTDKQRIQILTNKSGLPHIEKDNIRNFINRIHYPIYYLDFETINPQIPIYTNSRPYQHIPFLFSLHILESIDSKLQHVDYIQEDNSDPREPILKILSKTIGREGTILCFNDFFEKRCIQESLEVYPEYREWFEGIRRNFLDFAIPFKSFHYYSPLQNGSASLKEILPALTESSHRHLAIKNGHAANLIYLKLIKNHDLNNSQLQTETLGILKELKEYCSMDTYALYLIQKELEDILEERS